jgi:hypothetical protein
LANVNKFAAIDEPDKQFATVVPVGALTTARAREQ